MSDDEKRDAWGDAPLAEDPEIDAAHPLRRSHDDPAAHRRYGEAMRLVGARRSKRGLVDLVNWLLAGRDARGVSLSPDEVRARDERLLDAVENPSEVEQGSPGSIARRAWALGVSRRDARARADESVARLSADLEAAEARLAALLDSLPRCDYHRDRPATRAFARGEGRFCDACGAEGVPKKKMVDGERTRETTWGEAPEYPRAAAVRAALAGRKPPAGG